VDVLIEGFSRPERAGEDYQLVLDRVRRRVNERRFALGAQLVLARSDPIEVAEGYARVAEAAIHVLAGAALREFEAAHGSVPGSELLILGLGRLGGEALTWASDLDLVYLFSGTHEAVSDGAKPLRATDYFNRLAPRVTAALSVSTAAGRSTTSIPGCARPARMGCSRSASRPSPNTSGAKRGPGSIWR
jgi:glutamate-ammonia-ligase adenylyltransferase